MKNSLIFLFLILMPICLFSEVVVVNEDIAVEMALQNNLELKKQRLNQNSALEDKKTSYNAFYPKLSVTSAIAKSNTETTMYPYVKQIDRHVEITPDPTNFALSMEASLFLTPAIIDGIKLLNSSYQLEEIKTEKQRQGVIKDIKKSFYSLVVLQEQIKLLQYNHDELEKRYQNVKKNYESGFVDELTLLEVQVALENFKPQLTNLKDLYDLSIKNFKYALGIDQNIDIKIDGSIELEIIKYNNSELLETAITKGADVSILNKNIELLDKQINLTKNSAFFPILGFSYSKQTGLNDPFNSDLFDIEAYSDDQGSFNMFLSMDLAPLLPNSKERVSIKKLNNSKEIALLGKKQLTDGLDLQLSQMLQTLDNSSKLQESLNRTVLLAQKRLDLTKVAYKLGSKELLEVESAENELRYAQLELLREKHNYLSVQFDIEYLTGKGE